MSAILLFLQSDQKQSFVYKVDPVLRKGEVVSGFDSFEITLDSALHGRTQIAVKWTDLFHRL